MMLTGLRALVFGGVAIAVTVAAVPAPAQTTSTALLPRPSFEPALSYDTLSTPHVWRDSITWRLTRSGVLTGERIWPRTTWQARHFVRHTWKRHGALIAEVAAREGVPVEYLLAVAAIESRGDPRAVRREPGYVSDARTPHRAVLGMTQMLLSTARAVMKDRKIDRRWMFNPENALTAAARYMKSQARITQWDPPLVAAAYNAGGVYHQGGEKNRWKMRNYPIGSGVYINKFVYSFNASLQMFGRMDAPPVSSIAQVFRHGMPPQTARRPVPKPADLNPADYDPQEEFEE